MADSAPSLEIDPASELEFILNPTEATPTVILTLRHSGKKGSMAFKVKTTQPRRYLVRPNQGLISPGGSEQVQILLVEKDKQTLLESFERLGQTALDHCKDKFLVQSCGVDDEFETEYSDACKKDPAMGYDKLSSMWATVSANKSVLVANKKLHVRHVALVEGKAPSSSNKKSLPAPKEPSKPVDSMDQAELQAEVGSLREKYDELVAFSVNLTAERDILNNALEQTKRELNREVSKSAAQRNASNATGGRVGGGSVDSVAAAGISTFMLGIIAFVMFVLGVRLEAAGYVNFLKHIPVLNVLLGAPDSGAGDEL